MLRYLLHFTVTDSNHITGYRQLLWECQWRRWLFLFWSTASRKHRCSLEQKLTCSWLTLSETDILWYSCFAV